MHRSSSTRNVRRTKVSASGRVTLPADVRRRLGVGNGGDVFIELRGDEVVIAPIDQAVVVARDVARRVAAGRPEASVDAFLADRRHDRDE